MIGYISPDWGMSEWYSQEEEAQRLESYQEELVERKLDDCRKIAEKIAYSFRYAGDDFTDEEFLAETENEIWHDWLCEEAYEVGEKYFSYKEDVNELYEAMILICKRGLEDFTDCAWVVNEVNGKIQKDEEK